MFVVAKQSGGLWFLLNIKWCNHCMHIPTFMMPTIRDVQQLLHSGDCAFSIDLKDACLHIPTVKHHHFVQFALQNTQY